MERGGERGRERGREGFNQTFRNSKNHFLEADQIKNFNNDQKSQSLSGAQSPFGMSCNPLDAAVKPIALPFGQVFSGLCESNTNHYYYVSTFSHVLG